MDKHERFELARGGAGDGGGDGGVSAVYCLILKVSLHCDSKEHTSHQPALLNSDIYISLSPRSPAPSP